MAASRDIGSFELADITPPDTTITANPTNPSSSSTASFSFTGSDTGGSGLAGFQCQIDGGGFSPCTSPQTYVGLADGSHTFQVRAVDGFGNVDPTPASYTWLIDTTPTATPTSTPTNTPTSYADQYIHGYADQHIRPATPTSTSTEHTQYIRTADEHVHQHTHQYIRSTDEHVRPTHPPIRPCHADEHVHQHTHQYIRSTDAARPPIHPPIHP